MTCRVPGRLFLFWVVSMGSSWHFNLRSCSHGGAPVSASAQDRQRKGWLRHWKRFRSRKFQYWTASRSVKTIEKSWEINFLLFQINPPETLRDPYVPKPYQNHIKTTPKTIEQDIYTYCNHNHTPNHVEIITPNWIRNKTIIVKPLKYEISKIR